MAHNSLRIAVGIIVTVWASLAQGATAGASEFFRRWPLGPPATDDFFPIAVWLQAPDKADRYRAAGFNTYVGLWNGPTEAQLAALRRAGMKVICAQNAVALAHLDDPVIIGWMHGDEPDNAQSLGRGRGYGPPIAPAKIVEDYTRIRAADPSRPVLLNLGQGVAWDEWVGRGARNRHPEDYPEYVKGCDIASFDIYPVASSAPAVAGKLELVARGVKRLAEWVGPERQAWNCIECTHISNPASKATPEQVRSEVWMSIVHGSRGIIYFVHEWKPRFNEAALLSDAGMLAAVTQLNRQIARLAPVLNSPAVSDGVAVATKNPGVPVAVMEKRKAGVRYVFAVAMQPGETSATFTLRDLAGEKSVEVIDEGRTLKAKEGVFQDAFGPWGVHLYRIDP